MTNESFAILKQFVKERFVDKNGNENDYDVDLEEFNFQVRIV